MKRFCFVAAASVVAVMAISSCPVQAQHYMGPSGLNCMLCGSSFKDRIGGTNDPHAMGSPMLGKPKSTMDANRLAESPNRSSSGGVLSRDMPQTYTRGMKQPGQPYANERKTSNGLDGSWAKRQERPDW